MLSRDVDSDNINMTELYKQLKNYGHVKQGALMSKYTTFHIGGPVQFLLEVSETDKLVAVLNWLTGEGIPYFILGGGSNLLWQDDEWEGVVIKVSSIKYQVSSTAIEVDSGVSLSKLVVLAVQNSLSGLEWAAGVPGTVGGAVRGNAGAMVSDTASSLLKVEVWRDGEVIQLNPEECGFGYRGSNFKHNQDVILRAWYKTMPGDKTRLMQTIQGYIKQRNGHYPPFPSAGSFFKNIDFKNWPGELSKLPETFKQKEQVPVGWINEQNDLKGYTVGGAMVSKEHGNFLINPKGATQADVLAIVEEVKQRAYTNFGVTLEPEVNIQK